jgi:antibiotic biosynthesis monooxygenase (ABM) superfamily enzyme
MGKVIFTISYEIKPEKRDEYLSLTREMKEYFNTINKRDYSIFEQKGRKNGFTEIFIFNNIDEFNQLDDNDERMTELVQKLESLLMDGKMKYTTLIEIE